MTSVLEQQEQMQGAPVLQGGLAAPLSSSGYVSIPRLQEAPMFSRQMMNFSPSDRLTHVCVASDLLLLAMSNRKVFRIDLKQPDQHQEISTAKFSQSPLSGIYMDPLGRHILLAYTETATGVGGEVLYLHRSSTKLKPLSRARGLEITAVGWSMPGATPGDNTGALLLGTSKGLILETDIHPESDKMFSAGIEQYWKQLFDVSKGTPVTISGIEMFTSSSGFVTIFVLAGRRLYRFCGLASSDERPQLQAVFSGYFNKPDSPYRMLNGEPAGATVPAGARLQVTRSHKHNLTWMGCLTDDLIFHGQLVQSADGTFSLSGEGDKLRYPSADASADVSGDTSVVTRGKTVLALVLTDFHALLLQQDQLTILSLLSQEVVHRDKFTDPQNRPLNIVRDPTKGTVWLITTQNVYRYKISREDRNVWQIYTDKNEFELAKKYCDNNPAHLDTVNVKQAQVLFDAGEYQKSAEVFADTQTGFEAVCLKFLQAEKTDALKTFLQKKLEALKPKDKIQTTMLVVWLVEIYLSELSRQDGKSRSLQNEFEAFLASPKVTDCIKRNKSVIYDLMASHGDKENLIKLTIINKDFENVIRQNIYKKNYIEALGVLKAQGKRDLFYKFSPSLMQEIPEETVAALMEQAASLSPARLLPALVSCKHTQHTLKYLEFAVQTLGCADTAIHNLLLSLYASHDPPRLLLYLQQQGQNVSAVNYDVHYALRLCREKQLTEACVHLSSLLSLWEAAVELALPEHLQLAKDIANMPDNDQLRKKLWLNIAQHVISKNQKMEQAMQFVQECDLIKIEDILPFFSDFVTIDHFREPICNSLQEYNQLNQDLQEEMEEGTKAADQVRGEIQSFRNRCTVVGVGELCMLCDITLLLRPFYLFPCGHKVHSDCLLLELQPLLGPAKRNKLSELFRQLNSLGTAEGESKGVALRSDIDNILASECLYCGEHMIQAIDTPFIPEADWSRVIKEWE